MASEALIRKLEGLHTVETLSEISGLSRQAAINFASRLRKEGHLTSSGGGKQVRFYRITVRKQLERSQGMFDILNKYSPHMKLNPWFDHQVHGKYTAEDALVDAIKTKSFRAVLVSLRLFNNITDWSRLYSLANKAGCWQEVGALYDTSKLFFRVRKMPERYRKNDGFKKRIFIREPMVKEQVFIPIEKFWKINVPFRLGDIDKVEL